MKNVFKIFFIYCILLLNAAIAQINLIQNGSFEVLDSCIPDTDVPIPNIIQYAIGWDDALGNSINPNYSSPDLFNACHSNIYGVPENFYGYQNAFNGEGYAGIYIDFNLQVGIDLMGGRYRDFIQNELLEPVIKGCKYKVSFQFSYSSRSSYKTDGLQFIFSNNKITIPNNAAILNGTYFTFDEDSVTIIRFPELLEADTTDWWYFEREFYSNTPANFLTIGSILDSASTNNVFGWVTPFTGIQGKSGGYFDDIRLIQLDSNCLTGVNEVEKKESVQVYPNLIFYELNIITQSIKGIFEVSILDATGRIFQNQQFAGSGTHTLNLNGLAKGIYYCRIMQGDEVIVVEKVVKVE
jgi:hypothetical protein